MKPYDVTEIDRLAAVAREAWFDDGKSGTPMPWERLREESRDDFRRIVRRLLAEVAPERLPPDPKLRAEIEEILAAAPED